MPYQAANGISIYYEEQGCGVPLVLINGLALPMDLWFAQMADLSGDFRVIAPDNRGIGRTDKPKGDYTIAMMAADTVELLRALGIEKAHIAGLSMGGFIAQKIALSYPSMVDRLVLIATGMGGEKWLEAGRPFWENARPAIQGKTVAEAYRIDLTLMSAPGFAASHPDVIEKAAALRLKHPQPMLAFLSQFAACSAFDSNARTPAIRQPTLIILGDNDPLFPLPLADDFREALPQAKMIIYKNCGHAIHLEKSGQLSRDIREFLLA